MDGWVFADRLRGVSGDEIRRILNLSAGEGIISFAGGTPGDAQLPAGKLAELSADLLHTRGSSLLRYGRTEGFTPLREAIPGYLREEFSVRVSPEEVLVTTGSQQGIELLGRAFLNPGDAVLTESPTFLGALQTFRLLQARIIPLVSDGDGILPEDLEEKIRRFKPKLVYLIPTFQNPAGTSLSFERRSQAADIASRSGVLLLEDDPYRQLRYRGAPLPAIKALDSSGRTALLGSFSKVIAPGLRVGFITAPAEVIRMCAVLKQAADVHTPVPNQALAHAFLVRGLLGEHVKGLCAAYGRRLEVMLKELGRMKRLGLVRSFTKPEGGLFVFVTLPEAVDAPRLFERCLSRGVSFVPGEPFHPEGGHSNTLRLNFTAADEASILRGMGLLEDCLRQECVQ